MKMECSLCGEELEKDEDWNNRKKQHEKYHSLGREDGINRTKGTVIWVTVWK